jgi:hypothetical protein
MVFTPSPELADYKLDFFTPAKRIVRCGNATGQAGFYFTPGVLSNRILVFYFSRVYGDVFRGSLL